MAPGAAPGALPPAPQARSRSAPGTAVRARGRGGGELNRPGQGFFVLPAAWRRAVLERRRSPRFAEDRTGKTAARWPAGGHLAANEKALDRGRRPLCPAPCWRTVAPLRRARSSAEGLYNMRREVHAPFVRARRRAAPAPPCRRRRPGGDPRPLGLAPGCAGFPGAADHGSTDDAFALPAQVPAGRTLIIYENVGRESRHSFLLRLPDGLDRPTCRGRAEGGDAPPPWFFESTFPGFPGETLPGETSYVVVDLTPGSYVLFDDFMPPSSCRSAAPRSRPPRRQSAGTVELFDFTVRVPDRVAPGRQVWAGHQQRRDSRTSCSWPGHPRR